MRTSYHNHKAVPSNTGADNIAMARWLQTTVQGMLNAELVDTTIPVVDAEFSKSGDPRYLWIERVVARGEDITPLRPRRQSFA
jgi:hypothetical protein